MHDPYLNYCTDVLNHTDRFSHKRTHWDRYYVQDFTFEEIRSIHMHQRYLRRTTQNNKKYVMQTFQEVVDLIRLLNKEFPRTVNAERKVGIYVEIKDWQWNFEYAGHN